MRRFPQVIIGFAILLFSFVSSPSSVFADSWTSKGNLNFLRSWHTATLLNNGKVLIVGGNNNPSRLRNTEIYDPASGNWSRAADLSDVREMHTANLVIVNNVTKETRVLIVGGLDSGIGSYSNKAELYNPSNNTWSIAPSMTYKKAQHGSSILDDGKVIIAGGYNSTVLGVTEIYDPIANTWTGTDSLNTNRRIHVQVTFNDNQGVNKVMVMGGLDVSGNPLKSTEIYDPSIDTWTAGPDMNFPRSDFLAVVLHDGRILVVGGDSPDFNKSEVYNPKDNSWTIYPTSHTLRRGSQAMLLGNKTGYKVIAGGSLNDTVVQLFDPLLNKWSIAASMNNIRSRFTLTLLNDGTALAAGGLGGGHPGSLRTSEIYSPDIVISAPTPFLDLPWDYMGKGLSFNEAAMAIGSYFDHEYPLLSTSLAESPIATRSVVTFQGPERTSHLYSSHDGYDYGRKAQAHLGDYVLAAASGSATFVNTCGACGNAIHIDHGNGFQTRYYHLQKEGLVVTVSGQQIQVEDRQAVGRVGWTGDIDPNDESGAHIHFMVIQDKDNDGSFEDNVPDGATDPFGWQSKNPDPWEIFTFKIGDADKTGNKSYYLWKEKLDNLDATLTSNGGVFKTERYELDFPQGSVIDDIKLIIQSSPIVKTLNNLRSLGSTIIVNAFDSLGNAVTDFTKPFILTVDFSTIDLSSYDMSTISIYSNTDGINWIKELTAVDFGTGIATTQINHLTHFALMAERLDTTAPVTQAILNGLEGQSNWFRSDVEVSLNAEDDILGVDYTLFKKDGEDWETYVTPLMFTSEGHHKIEFYSVDKDENIEEIKSVEFDIDKTIPEAKIFIDQDIWDLIVNGIDQNQTTVERLDNTETNRKDDAFYIVKDIAGNSLMLDVRDRDKEKKDYFRIYSLRYNEDLPVMQPDNKYDVSYKGKKDMFNINEQRFEIEKELKIKIKFDSKKNQSEIITKETGVELKEIKDGLMLLQIMTEKGALEYSY